MRGPAKAGPYVRRRRVQAPHSSRHSGPRKRSVDRCQAIARAGRVHACRVNGTRRLCVAVERNETNPALERQNVFAAAKHVTESGAAKRIRWKPRFHAHGERIVEQPKTHSEREVISARDRRRFTRHARHHLVTRGGSAPVARFKPQTRWRVAVCQHVDSCWQQRPIETLFPRRRQHAEHVWGSGAKAGNLLDQIRRRADRIALEGKQGTERRHDIARGVVVEKPVSYTHLTLPTSDLV